jgi:predicted metal-dependent HD superfamily phosphohydrolase
LIYDPRYTNNEEQSIGKFENFASDVGMATDSTVFKATVDLIRLSATHSTDEHRNEHAYGSDDKHYFLDMDMAILGATPYEYTMYSRKIREEYSFLAETIYRQLRAKVGRVC